MRTDDIQAGSGAARPYRTDKLVHQLFEAQASKDPGALATICREEALTYAHLNRRANQLAWHLRSLGVQAGEFVAVCLERSTDLVVAVLAVLKAGAAYLPLDPAHPATRTALMIEDTAARTVITTSDLRVDFGDGLQLVFLDQCRAALAAEPEGDLSTHASIDDLAYVIYTSGSTGRPKGVLVRHRSMLNLISWVNTTFSVGPDDRLLFVASICFDLSVYDIFGMLASGGSLHIATRDELQSPQKLVAALESGTITFWDSAPAALTQLVPLFPARAVNNRLRLVFLSGDWIPLTLPDQVRSVFTAAEVIALGGATEATVWSNYYRVGNVDPRWNSIPYGRPIDNARYHILDAQLQPVASGEQGDLYIGGTCVAAGYHNRPELDAQSFLADPFHPDEGTRLYRTGDRARYMADGNIEFLGRLDDQVKIRGHRIEIGEVESTLNRIDGVGQSVVLARPDHTGDKMLVAYFVPQTGRAQVLDRRDIVAALRRQLPDYMVPAHVVELDRIPLTDNGKVDRRTLPEPIASSAVAYSAPKTPVEEALESIWAGLLSVPHIGVDDDFFELGGNSLLATRMVAHIRTRLQCEVDLSTLFTSPTIAGLAPHIRPGSTPATAPVRRPAVSREDRVPMSSTQERIWFLWQSGAAPSLYNVCAALDVDGPIDVAALETALAGLVSRHEILRTTFDNDASGGVQIVHERGRIPLTVRESTAEEIDRATQAEAEGGFDLHRGPCCRALLLRHGTGRSQLILTQHHLLTDEWSLGLLLRELAALYRGARGETDATLPRGGVQFGDFSIWQRSQPTDDDLAFFERYLSGAARVLELPTDYPRRSAPTYRGRVVRCELDAAFVESLQQFARANSATVFAVLLSGLNVLLQRVTGADDILVGSPVATRMHTEVEQTVGFFSNTVVIRSDLSGQPCFRDAVRRVQATVHEVLQHQGAPFDLVSQLTPRTRRVAERSFPQVAMMLRNDAPQTLDAGDATWRERLVFTDTSKFELTFVVVPSPGGADLFLEYATDLFGAETATGLVRSLRDVLADALARPATPIAELGGITVARAMPSTDADAASELPEPDGPSAVGPVPREAATETERVLTQIWAALLHTTSIRPTDDFFDLGGHSLLALRMVAQVENAFAVALPFKVVLAEPTIRALAAWLEAHSAGSRRDSEDPTVRIERVDRSQPQPLSSSQLQVWIVECLAPGNGAYHIGMPLRIVGPLDRRMVQRAVDALVERQGSLRTVFLDQDDGPMQLVMPSTEVGVEWLDCAGDDRAAIDATLVEVIQRPFDLGSGPLLRCTLCRTADGDHVLLFVLHHIIADGWSLEILRREFFHLYRSCRDGSVPTLPPLPIQYVDYAAWQHRDAARRDSGGSVRYWRDRLAGAPEVIALPVDRPRPPRPSFRGGRVRVDIDPTSLAAFIARCRDLGASLFVGGLAAFKLLLARHGRQDDIVVGAPFALRQREELQGLIADSINTVALRTSLAGNPTAAELIGRVRQTTNSAFDHADLPIERLVREVVQHRAASYNPIFQVLFNVDAAASSVEKTDELVVSDYWLDPGRSQLDLSLYLRETTAGLQCDLYYNGDIFDRDTAIRFVEAYVRIVQAFARDRDIRIDDVPLLDEHLTRTLLSDWNATAAPFAERLCVHDLFEARAAATPEAIAVVMPATEDQPHRRFTYAQLNRQANQLARVLRARGVATGDLVALCLERSPAMLVGMLGINKAGAAYLPLDASYPAHRLEFMVADSRVRTIVTDATTSSLELARKLDVVSLDPDLSAPVPTSDGDLGLELSSDGLAYVIYTSGSTGHPKGVEVGHRSVVNFLTAMARQPGLTAADRLLAVTTLSFDIAGLELLLPLTVGAQVVLARSQELADGARLAELVATQDITLLQATPTTWRLMLESGWQGSPQLVALCGGETLPRDLAAQLATRCRSLWNMYGPTETTIWSTVAAIRPEFDRITIGRPIANTAIYVLDDQRRLVPIGVPGELCIGGAGLARGYRDRPELTAERFVDNPFAPGSRIYRTGDLARYLPDGRIECLGRIDTQIKLRGFRIELGEIEHALTQIGGIDEAIVSVQGNGSDDQFLVAYFRGTRDVPIREQREFLRTRLPAQMIPRESMRLAEFRLLPNGKVDRSALPPIANLREDTPEPPATELQLTLARIWRETLGLETVGIHDSFFDLGGSSLVALRLCTRIERELRRKFPPAALLQTPTIAGIAAWLSSADAAGARRSHVVLLGGAGDQPPLFFFPGVGGHPFTFIELAQRVGGSRPVYGVRLIGTDDEEPALENVEHMARRYIDELIGLHPKGPLYLAGYSAGGWIAYEIAIQLQRRGHPVGCLILIDCDAPGYLQWGRLEKARYFFRQEFLNASWRGRYEFLAKHVRSRFRRLGRSLGVFEESPAEEVTRLMWRAVNNYVGQPLAGDALLIRARESIRPTRFDDPVFGWNRLIRGTLSVGTVPGDHLGVLAIQNVPEIARVLGKYLASRPRPAAAKTP